MQPAETKRSTIGFQKPVRASGVTPVMDAPATPRIIGAVLIVVWSVARVVFWRMARGRSVTLSDMTLRRRVLLAAVSLSLVPIYVYYFAPFLDRFSLIRPPWIGWIGDALLAAAVALFIWSHRSLGTNWTARVDVARGQHLITTGAYRWVRHPMYASFFLMSVALLIATANPLVALPFGMSITMMYVDRVGAEERIMAHEFGEPYTEYLSRTGRLFPRRCDRGPRDRR